MRTLLFHKTSYLCITLLLLAACENKDYSEDVKVAMDSLPDRIDYNWHIRPILSDKCFACHGPQADAEAGLQLHTAESANAPLMETPGSHAIVPGKPHNSALVDRILSDDQAYQMPPPNSHLALNTEEKAALIKWIEQGAEYKPHWSFIAPEKMSTPKAGQDWAINEIDHFIAARLESEGLSPSSRASMETLMRRASFDVTGLPPTLQDIESLGADTDYSAYVDKLLALPAYGERMAAMWMDVARYADSDGYLDDKHRVVYPWRDWVIDAFNTNMPYDQFVTWQLAGDLLPNSSKDQTLATAFNRLHKKNSEAGINFEEFRLSYVSDRVDTFGTAFLGLTTGCARCHDHKYDPVSHIEYYQLAAFFNSTDEIGTAVYGPGQTPGPSLLLSTESEDDRLSTLISNIQQAEIALHNVQEKLELELENIEPKDIARSREQALLAHYSFDTKTIATEEKDVLLLPEVTGKAKHASIRQGGLSTGFKGKAFKVDDYNNVSFGEGVGLFDRTEPFSIELWVLPGKVHNEAALILHTEDLRIGFKGYSVHLEENRLRFIMARSWPNNSLELVTDKALAADTWQHVVVTYDGSSRAEGVAMYIDGERATTERRQDRLTKSIAYVEDIHTYGLKGLEIGARNKLSSMKDGFIDELKVYSRDLSALEIQHAFREAQDKPLPSLDSNLLREHAIRIHPSGKEPRNRLHAARVEHNQFISRIPELMVMGDTAVPRPTYLLERGEFNLPGEQVWPATPEAVLNFDAELPKNRLGLSQWLFDKRNPLTARVFVNRIWQMHFGQGLVKTAADFGNQGSMPSHPELLDWLSVYFINSGWDIKSLHRLILTSATYQQSSAITDQLLAHDPENIFLARGPANRLEAEMIRDNALAISGLLDKKIGGESVYPYQPPGLWDDLSTKKWRYDYPEPSDVGDGLYRRSIYSFIKRSAPTPNMAIFDAPSRDACMVQRNTSSTPLQALVLLNDTQFIEASRVLANRVRQISTELDQQIKLLFQLTTGRKPFEKEMAAARELYLSQKTAFEQRPDDATALIEVGERDTQDGQPIELAAMTMVANTLMNTDEAYMKR